MIPGELFPASGEITLNEGRPAVTLLVATEQKTPRFRRRLNRFDEETLYCVQTLAWSATMVASVFSLAVFGVRFIILGTA